MKKIQLRAKKKNQINEDAAPARITNETVAEHREQILAGGRRFKYPHQYARHKLVFNAVLISLVTLVLLIALGWQQLYLAQNTSNFFYRVTRIIPVPVATVDGNYVRFSDYLMTLSGSKHYFEQTERIDLSSPDGKRIMDYQKRQALDGAIADTYAAKLAHEKKLSISDSEVDKVIESSLDTVTGKISQEVYNDSTYSTLGYTPDEYRHIIKRSLIRQEVAYAIDEKARTIRTAAEALLKTKKTIKLSELASELKVKGYKVQVGNSGLVPRTNHDGGLSQAALQLKAGQFSSFIRSTKGDGYYLLQLVKANDSQLSYNFLRIPLTEFDMQLKSLKTNNKIQEFISIKKTTATTINE